MAAKRIQKELQCFSRQSAKECSAEPMDGDIFHWKATIRGPSDTPYEGGLFCLKIDFPPDYPFTPPLVCIHLTPVNDLSQVIFITKIYHPNVYDDGKVCLGALGEEWSADMTVSKVLLAVCALLAEPNSKSPTNQEMAKQLENNRAVFDRNARLWTKRYAIPDDENPHSMFGLSVSSVICASVLFVVSYFFLNLFY